MLDDFKEEQKVAYKILKNSIDKEIYSHAYLFDTNNYKYSNEFILSFVKALLCSNKCTNECSLCHQCENIEKNIYPELKIINPDGLWIKKEQLLELQDEFKTKSLTSSKRVYIINNAEALNDSAANSILKFLEEPQPGIIAILVTNNIHQLLDTIISRCQVITLKSNDKSEDQFDKINDYLTYKCDKEVLENFIEKTIDFIDYQEKNKQKTILFTKSLFFDKFIEKEDINTFFELSIILYKDALNYKLSRNLEYFTERDVKSISDRNGIDNLNRKIKILLDTKNNLKINVNNNLMLDKLIIDLGSE